MRRSMLKEIVLAVTRTFRTPQPILLVAFMQLANAQNVQSPAPNSFAEFQQELPKALRFPEVVAGTVSAASLQHRVPKEARKAYERALKKAKRDGRPDVEAAA